MTISLPRNTLIAARSLAAARDMTLGQIIRDQLARELRRCDNAKTPNRADEQLVARLQRLLAPTMADATGWPDLEDRLRQMGYVLHPAGGGLTLHCARTGERLCKSSELGFAYGRLVRRFNAPMPGHPHKMAHLLKDPAETDGVLEDDFDVIEPF